LLLGKVLRTPWPEQDWEEKWSKRILECTSDSKNQLIKDIWQEHDPGGAEVDV